MKSLLEENMVPAQLIANTILAGFNRHYQLFRKKTATAKSLFEQEDWVSIQQLGAERIQMYDTRVQEALDALHQYDLDVLHDDTWMQTKREYIALLVNHHQPELAETFFNSVMTKLLDKSYYNNQYIFLKPATSIEYIESETSSFVSFYPTHQGLRGCLKKMLNHFSWQRPFAHLNQDIANILRAARHYLQPQGEWPLLDLNLHIQVLNAPFFRNKAAYLMGQIIHGSHRYPFALPIVFNHRHQLVIDAAIFDPKQISVLFSFARAYFLVDMEVPSAFVRFLREMLPMRGLGDFYTLLGLHKQGKNIFWREFQRHLEHSQDKFILAPGIKGQVMSVFTLPSFPYVFKVIKDIFSGNKTCTREQVREKYLLVKKHDRVGRMADTLEYSGVVLPKSRCHAEMLEEMRQFAPSQIEEKDDMIIIKHVYIEHRLQPLNLFLQNATPEAKKAALIDYGYAIKELASANIFPGDLLYKNFGMTRFGRVIFYDYDEIEYMTDCQFRRIPPPPSFEAEMSDEIWYPVHDGDVFPEEFAFFLLGNEDTKQVLMQYHEDLFHPEFWQNKKEKILRKEIEDFFPYPQSVRFKPRTLADGITDLTDV